MHLLKYIYYNRETFLRRERGGSWGRVGTSHFLFFHQQQLRFLRPRRPERKTGRRKKKTKHAEPLVQFTWQTTSATRSLAVVYKGKKTLADALAVLLAWHAVASFWCALVWRVNGWRWGGFSDRWWFLLLWLVGSVAIYTVYTIYTAPLPPVCPRDRKTINKHTFSSQQCLHKGETVKVWGIVNSKHSRRRHGHTLPFAQRRVITTLPSIFQSHGDNQTGCVSSALAECQLRKNTAGWCYTSTMVLGIIKVSIPTAYTENALPTNLSL